jgi:hypothetical protein
MALFSSVLVPKPSTDIQDLKRRLARLARLDDRAMVCADGVFLIEPAPVRDPRPLVAACKQGRPSSTAIRAALGMHATPPSIGAAFLAAAHRDLRTLETAPALVALAEEAPRIFRRYGTIDERWIAQKRARIAQLAELGRIAEGPVPAGDEGHPPWFRRVMDLVDLLHGEGAAAAVERALAQLQEGARTRRAEARRALNELLLGLAGERAPTIDRAARALRLLEEAADLPGRRRDKRVAAALRELFDAPTPSVPAGLPVAVQVKAAGEAWIAGLGSARDPALRDQALRFFAHFALAFDPRPRDGGALSLRREQIDRALTRIDAPLETFCGRALRLPEILAILDLSLGWKTTPIVALVEKGLPIAKVTRLAALGKAEALSELGGDVEAAETYADWAITLLPHYKSLGLEVPITPAMVAGLRARKKGDLAVLAICLMKHHAEAGPAGAEQAIARLDTTLGLFRRRPAEAAGLLAELSSTSPGAGRAAFPAFAAWLDDDPLLDRYAHLSRLARLPLALPQRFLSAFERSAALGRERAHLDALPARSAAQEARLLGLEAGTITAPGPAWTQRRLEERVRELHALAYEACLDEVFRRLVHEVWGITLDRLTPGFRDAIRFYLSLERNGELLGTVLRGAAAGVDLARTLPKNRAYLEAAAARFDVEAWLAPREKQLLLGGRPHTLSVERDPVEVLRMGIPFDTCLALETGCNAASTVINAADASKRVLYLRERGGRIVARKLLAISDEDTLLGYNLYNAAAEHEAPIAAAFQAMCAEIAAASRLPLASSGTAKQIHQGFWYDDGAVPFDGEPHSPGIAAYCRALGVPPPRVASTQLRRDSAIFATIAREDLAAIRALLTDSWRTGGLHAEAARWLIARLSPAEEIALARRSSPVADASLQRAALDGAVAMLRLLGKIASMRGGDVLDFTLQRFPRSAEIARALADAARPSMRSGQPFDDHGLEHQTMYILPAYAVEIPVETSLDLCDRIDPVWAWVTEHSPGCATCREGAELQTLDAIAVAHARAPDPDAVLHHLAAARSSLFARRAALHLAALFPLDQGSTAPLSPPPARQALRSSPAAMRALAQLRRRAPELEAAPDLLAALLRQSAGKPPHGVHLPAPPPVPHPILGDLLLQLDLPALCAHWPAPSEAAPPLAEAFATVERQLRGEPLDEGALTAARETLVTHAPASSLHLVLERVLDRPTPLADADHKLALDYLERRSHVRQTALPPGLVLRIARHPGLRAPLARALARLDDDCLPPLILAVRDAALRAGEPALFEALFDAWIDALLGAHRDTVLADLDDHALLRRAVRVTLAEGSATRVLALYRTATTHAQALRILEALDESPERATPAMQAEVEAMHAWSSADAENAVRHDWLRARMKRWLREGAPGEAQGP